MIKTPASRHDRAMHSTVRLQRRILAFLALMLLFNTQSLGAYVYMLHRIPSLQADLRVVAMHSAGLLGCGLLAPFLLARGRGFPSPLPVLLALIVLLISASHAPAWQGSMLAFSLRALCLGMFWPLALYAFFQVTPQPSRGLLLGLLIAAGELLWLALLPVMQFFLSDPSTVALVGFMHKLQIVLQCAIGLALAAFFALSAEEEERSPDVPEKDAAPFVLPLLFVTATLLYIAYGLISGLNFPKLSHTIVSESAHIALLLTMPVAGALMDRGGRMLLAALACLAFIAPAMLFAREAEMQEALYIALHVGRQGVFLTTLLLADRLIRNRKRLPLSFALAYILLTTGAMPGNAIARALEDAALKSGLAVCLILVFAALLLRLRSTLADMPLVRPLSWDEDSPTPEPGLPIAPDPGRLVAFGKTYGLSGQENVVMAMLAQGRSTEDIAKAMHVAEKTVRTYVSRMLQKAKVHNRAALITLFAAQSPSPTDPAEPDEPASDKKISPVIPA